VLLLDEPLAGLDAGSGRDLLNLLAQLRAERGRTVVVVTHHLDGVEVVCDRVVRLERGEVALDAPLASPATSGGSVA
jgi:energy-coupling factor transport system ATP-binding protein